MDRDVDGPEGFHWVVADSQKFKHDVYLLDSDMVLVIHIEQANRYNNDYR